MTTTTTQMRNPDSLLREDALARRIALDVSRSFIVQAPAGSGKTELLVQRFLALLATVDQPEALLAITFTRKAAAEMRNRILDALRSWADPAAALRDETRALAQHALQADEQRGWGLLRNPSRLRLLTIDALNQSLARRLPVMSGLGAGLGVAEDGRELHALAAERLLSHLPADEPRFAIAVATLLEYLDNNAGKLVELIGAMLARREAWLPVVTADLAAMHGRSGVREELESARTQLISGHLQALVQAFPPALLEELCACARDAAAVLRSCGKESPILACDDGVPGSDPGDVAYWQGLAHFVLTSKHTPRRAFNVSVGVRAKVAMRPELAQIKARVESAAAELARHPELWEPLAATRALPSPVYGDDEWRVLEALLLVLQLAAAELKGVFAERKNADYPEFAAAARLALGTPQEPTDTALALDARLRHVLVDEFQDTSEAQVQLLESLTAGWQRDDGRTLFLVGDPMQSIYRFRNAEVGLFLHVRDHGLGGLQLEPLTLRVNFRSTRPLVTWVNQCFAAVLPERDDVLRGAVRFAESVAAPQMATVGGVHVHAFLRSSRKAEARTVVDLVEQTHRANAEARIAILVQARGDLVEIVAELARRAVPFQATDIDPLGARPAVLDLLALTRALVHLGDRAAWLGVLRAPWCGLRLEDCHALLGDDRRSTALRLLQDGARRARLDAASRSRLERCLPVLDLALDELRRFGLRDAVERAWHALGGPATLLTERELDEARAYFDVLGTLESESPGMPVDLARLSKALQQLYAPTRPCPDTRVELLTIHKSKGLQFDTVIVPGLDRAGRSDDPPLLRWLKLPGTAGHGLVIAPITESGAEKKNPLHAWLGRLEKEKLLQEKRRLLYVAATRAERSLHLLGSCAVEHDDQTGQFSLRAPRRGCALDLLWGEPSIADAFAQRLADIAKMTADDGSAIARDPILLRLPDTWHMPVLPEAPPIVFRDVHRSLTATKLEFDWASETARHVGTVVHRELQRLARIGTAGVLSEEYTHALERRALVELAELGVPHARRAQGAARVVAAVERTLKDVRGNWLFAARHHAAESELALTGTIDGEVVSVVIDRTFIDETGTRWIVDYKTSTHEGAGVEEFLDSERERYGPQLERYAALIGALGREPIRLGLYFPLLSAWREWSR
jgi:ATP-dependent exoDNAse (exonuclease V) beta subunit